MCLGLTVSSGPGNFMEVRKMLPMLTEGSPDHPSFHVVALSLPGFGFSAAPNKTGFGIAKYAEVFWCFIPRCSSLTFTVRQVGHKLMLALGYNEYGLFSVHAYRDCNLYYNSRPRGRLGKHGACEIAQNSQYEPTPPRLPAKLPASTGVSIAKHGTRTYHSEHCISDMT